jgi:hypothetical protein
LLGDVGLFGEKKALDKETAISAKEPSRLGIWTCNTDPVQELKRENGRDLESVALDVI